MYCGVWHSALTSNLPPSYAIFRIMPGNHQYFRGQNIALEARAETTQARRKKMAVKKATPAKKAPVKKRKVGKGDSYVCGVCGLAVVVDEACGCVDVCDIICCGKTMKARAANPKTPKAKATKK